MKNKYIFSGVFFFVLITFLSNLALSDEFEFTASEIVSSDNGNLVKGIGGVEINDGLGLIITGEKLEYNKPQSILEVNKNVLIKDKLNKSQAKSNQIIFNKGLNTITSKDKTIVELDGGYIIKGSNIIFDRNLNTITSKDKTIVELDGGYIIKGSNIIFDRNSNTITSKDKTLFTDSDNNKLNMKEFTYSTNKKILKTSKVKITDIQGNIYNSENIRYHLKTKEILGKDLSMTLNNNNFDSNKNEPRVKGNAFFHKINITQINKGVFTTCKKTDTCPPWVLSSEEIKHDKVAKRIDYKNAWLKIYDIPVVYFPKFFHPDPTVKRQSGFLVPGFSQSSITGNYLQTPYYNAISESTDATFTPRFYDDGKAIYQTEYRNILKNSEHIVDFSFKNKSAVIIDEETNSTAAHFFSNSKFNLNLNNFEESQLKLKIQQTSNNDYLKTYKLTSPLIETDNILHSSINFNASTENLELDTTAEIYENLSLSSSDKYEYIYPSINILKNIYESDLGNLTLNASAQNKRFNTNTSEKTFTNDFNFKSHNKISTLGLLSSYEILLKNFNVKSKKSTTYKNKNESDLNSIVKYEMKYPLQKIERNFVSTFTPTVSVLYSPDQSKNKSKNDRIMNFNNIFSINRIGFLDTVEGGQSITVGSEYTISNSKNADERIFSINLATVFRDEENDKLPINSTLGEKTSDIFGGLGFVPNESIDLSYNFALDNNLRDLNYNEIKSTISIFNVVSTFDFLEKNNILGSESYISNETKLTLSDNSSFGFKTRKNKDTDLTEYYNFIYQYRNDCLVAGLEFKKDFYSDGSLRPDEQLFFSVTIMPLGKINTPDLKQ